MAGMADAPSTELVLSPRWAVSVGEIDGTAHVTLPIQHPRLGELAFLLPNNDAIEMAAALEKPGNGGTKGGCAAPRRKLAARPKQSGCLSLVLHPGGQGLSGRSQR